MVDIATVSVVSSSLVALGTLGVTFVGGERQRKHESDLDFEARVWERKSEALFTVMEQCRRVIESNDPVTDDNRLSYALEASKVLDKLHGARPTVEAFASSRCRDELNGLIEVFEQCGVQYGTGARVARLWKQEMETSPSEDYETWKRVGEWRKDAEGEVIVGFEPDLDLWHRQAQRLLDAARESVRRPKD
jgi:hypothetical protein